MKNLNLTFSLKCCSKSTVNGQKSRDTVPLKEKCKKIDHPFFCLKHSAWALYTGKQVSRTFSLSRIYLAVGPRVSCGSTYVRLGD